MIARLLQILFFIFIIYLVIGVVKFIFRVGRATGELNRSIHEKNRENRKEGPRKNGIIELDKDQYKVE